MKRRKFSLDKDQLAFSLRKKVPWTNRPIVLGVLFIGVLFFGRAAFRVYNSRAESAKAAAEAQNQLTDLQNRKNFLDESLNRLSTTEGQETELRRRFGVARPDESVAIIVESGDDNTPTSTPSFWSKVKNFFK